jgi:hypothetical protein
VTLIHTVDLGAGVYDCLGMVGEFGQMDAVFLRLQLFRMFPLLAVVHLESIVIAGDDGELARVVEVERRYRRVVSFRSESLLHVSSGLAVGFGIRLTRHGLKVAMTSLTFWLGGCAGGAGVSVPAAIV